MRRFIRALGSVQAILFAAILAGTSCSAASASDGDVERKEVPAILKEMQPGWNLGNTLDALGSGLSSETAWGQPKTTHQMITGLKNSGIRTVRIPVSWALHLDRDGVIDSKWMARVKEIVDWCIDDGMFVILNIHHDNCEREGLAARFKGYYPSKKKQDVSVEFVTTVWRQVSQVFKDYDEHLIFETLNEPRPRGTNIEWWNQPGDSAAKGYAKVVNVLNQAAVDTIRASGGGNASRYIMCPALRASATDAFTDDFVLPHDDAGRILVSVHAYTPNNFAMASPGDTKFTDGHKSELRYVFDMLEDKFTSRGIGVVIGEYGATNKNNLDERVKWFRFIHHEAALRSIPLCLWDNGATQTGSGSGRYAEKFGYYNRQKCTWYFPEILEAMKEP